MNGFQHQLLAVTPLLVFVLIAVIVGGAVYFSSDKAVGALEPHTSKLKERLDRASISVKTEDIGIGLFAATGIIWAAFTALLHPTPLLAIVALPLTAFIVWRAFTRWVEMRIAQRIASFNNQLEIVLRMMSSAIRSGLGMRQAMIMVTEEMPDPARYEFNLTIKQTNIGLSINDALSRLALRMPSAEMDMLTKAIQIQSQTGGNLGKTIDHLAATIKDRRKLLRKVKTLTAEARASAMVIGFLPIGLALFIFSTQAHMREVTFGSRDGLMVLAAATFLEGMGIFVLTRLLKFKV